VTRAVLPPDDNQHDDHHFPNGRAWTGPGPAPFPARPHAPRGDGAQAGPDPAAGRPDRRGGRSPAASPAPAATLPPRHGRPPGGPPAPPDHILGRRRRSRTAAATSGRSRPLRPPA